MERNGKDGEENQCPAKGEKEETWANLNLICWSKNGTKYDKEEEE